MFASGGSVIPGDLHPTPALHYPAARRQAASDCEPVHRSVSLFTEQIIQPFYKVGRIFERFSADQQRLIEQNGRNVFYI